MMDKISPLYRQAHDRRLLASSTVCFSTSACDMNDVVVCMDQTKKMFNDCVRHFDASQARQQGHRCFVLMRENVNDLVPALKNLTFLKQIKKNEPVLHVHALGISLAKCHVDMKLFGSSSDATLAALNIPIGAC